MKMWIATTRKRRASKSFFGRELNPSTLTQFPMATLEKNLVLDAGYSNVSLISCDSLIKVTASAHTDWFLSRVPVIPLPKENPPLLLNMSLSLILIFSCPTKKGCLQVRDLLGMSRKVFWGQEIISECLKAVFCWKKITCNNWKINTHVLICFREQDINLIFPITVLNNVYQIIER